MEQIVVNYATVRFRPYPETGEFVNIGVVAASPQTACLEFRLLKTRIRRVTNFFPELNPGVFRSAIRSFRQHLEGVQAQWNPLANMYRPPTPDQVRVETLRFQELIRVRESLVQFGPVSTLLGTDLESTVEELFARYVERLFAREPEYQETVMQDRLISQMKQWEVQSRFRRDAVGDDLYHVTFPFVRTDDKGLVIKPLNLDRPETSDISDHGDKWVSRLHRLQKIHRLPQQTVFQVAMPTEPARLKAAEEIVAALKEHEATVLPYEDSASIRKIVTAA